MRLAAALLAVIAWLVSGCASRLPPRDARCARLDDARIAWRGVAVGATALSGAQGLGTIPADGDAQTGLAIGAAVAAGVAVAAQSWGSGASELWARECAEREGE